MTVSSLVPVLVALLTVKVGKKSIGDKGCRDFFEGLFSDSGIVCNYKLLIYNVLILRFVRSQLGRISRYRVFVEFFRTVSLP